MPEGLPQTAPGAGKPPRPGNRRIRLLALVLAVIALLALGWAGIERLLNVERYRSMAQERLESLLGMEVAIGPLDLEWFPTPHLAARAVRVGQGGFSFTLDAVHAHASWDALVRGELAIGGIRGDGAVLQLPAAAEERTAVWLALRNALEALRAGPEAATGELPVSVGRVALPGLEVRLGGAARYTGTVSLSGLTGEESQVRFRGTAHAGDLELPASGMVLVHWRGAAPPEVQGDFRLDELPLQALNLEGLDKDRIPDYRAQVGFQAEGVLGPDLPIMAQAALEGGAWPDGRASAQLWWRGDRVLFNDLEFQAKGLEARADGHLVVVPGPDERIALRIIEARAGAAEAGLVLPLLFAKGEPPLSAGPGAGARVADLLCGLYRSQGPRLVSGWVEFDGFAFAPEGGLPAIEGLSGAASIQEGTLQFSRLSMPEAELTGALRLPRRARENGPPAEAGEFAAAGTVSAAHPWVRASLPEALEGARGEIVLDALDIVLPPAGQVIAAGDLLPRLNARGHLSEAAARVNTPFLEAPFDLEGVEASFQLEHGVLTSNVEIGSSSIGPLRWSGRVQFQERWAEGTCMAGLDEAAGLLPGEAFGPSLHRVLEAFAAAPLDLAVQWPAPGEQSAGSLKLNRESEPSFALQAGYQLRGDEFHLDGMTASARLPAQVLEGILPPRIEARGVLHTEVTKASGAAHFLLRADASGLALKAGRYIEKRLGDPMGLEISGLAGGWPWQLTDILVTCLGERVQVGFTPGGWRLGPLELDLAPLARLLPPGARAAGRVNGEVTGPPLNLELTLNKVAAAPAPEVAFDLLDGTVALSGGQWRARDFRVLGAGSDCTINAGGAAEAGASWEARIEGAKLNVDAVAVMLDAARSFTRTRTPPGEGEPSAEVGNGRLLVRLDEVHFRRAILRAMRARARMTPQGVEIEQFSCVPIQGVAQGHGRYHFASANSPARLDTGIEFEGVAMRVLDDMFLAQPRGLRGVMAGKAKLSLPMVPGVPPYKGMSGVISMTAADGNYGQFGITTQLLTALKAAEILRLRLPSLVDQGLTFQESRAELMMKDGLVEVRDFLCRDKAYSIEASGLADLAQEQLQLSILVNVIESVTGLVGAIPGLRKPMEALGRGASLRYEAAGSPFDPVIRPARAGALRGGEGAHAEDQPEAAP